MTDRTIPYSARTAGAWAALGACLALSTVASAQQITRGPFLQSVTKDSVYVVWEQDAASQPEIRYGSSGTSLDQAVTAEARTSGVPSSKGTL